MDGNLGRCRMALAPCAEKNINKSTKLYYVLMCDVIYYYMADVWISLEENCVRQKQYNLLETSPLEVRGHSGLWSQAYSYGDGAAVTWVIRVCRRVFVFWAASMIAMAKPYCLLILLVVPVLTICLAEVVFEERFDGKGKGEGVEFFLAKFGWIPTYGVCSLWVLGGTWAYRSEWELWRKMLCR